MLYQGARDPQLPVVTAPTLYPISDQLGTHYWQVLGRLVLQALRKVQIKVHDVLQIYAQLGRMPIQGVPASNSVLSLSASEKSDSNTHCETLRLTMKPPFLLYEHSALL